MMCKTSILITIVCATISSTRSAALINLSDAANLDILGVGVDKSIYLDVGRTNASSPLIAVGGTIGFSGTNGSAFNSGGDLFIGSGPGFIPGLGGVGGGNSSGLGGIPIVGPILGDIGSGIKNVTSGIGNSIGKAKNGTSLIGRVEKAAVKIVKTAVKTVTWPIREVDKLVKKVLGPKSTTG